MNTSTEVVPNHLVWAILSTIAAYALCCFACIVFPACVTGIVAIVYASQVNSRLMVNDFIGARSASQTAKVWCWVTTGFILLGIASFMALFLFGGLDTYQEYLDEARQQIGS